MSISSEDLLGVAEQMATRDSEVEWRAGASRAYYAAFHRAKDVADRCLPPNLLRMGEHESLTERFKVHGIKGKSIAYVLVDLKKVRTHADYHIRHNFLKQDGTDQVSDCKSFCKQVDGFQAIAQQSPVAGI
jgi:hypothetical protein